MFALRKSKTKASSRQQIAIKGVRDGILTLPRHQYRAAIEVSPLNFELKSEEEQDAIIDTYESFLNSVGSSLQILIRTRQIDMDNYLSELSARFEGESKPIYKQQLQHYDEFIRSLISSNTILTRRFYIIVPMNAPAKADFELAREQLNLQLDIVSKGMMRLGMQARQLSSLELLDLFYSFYSPAQAKLQPLSEQALRLIHTTLIKKGESSDA